MSGGNGRRDVDTAARVYLNIGQNGEKKKGLLVILPKKTAECSPGQVRETEKGAEDNPYGPDLRCEGKNYWGVIQNGQRVWKVRQETHTKGGKEKRKEDERKERFRIKPSKIPSTKSPTYEYADTP